MQKQEFMMKTKKITKLIRGGKNNKVNDIFDQKYFNVLRGLQKKKNIMQISIENGKSKRLFYIYKNKHERNNNNKENTFIIHLQEKE
jgi:hypothetical protein